MARARSTAKLSKVSACYPSRSTVIRAAAAQKRAALGMTRADPAAELWEIAIRAIRQLVSACAKLCELATVIIPSKAALPKIKAAAIMRAGVIRILSIRARLAGQADTIIRRMFHVCMVSLGLWSLCSDEEPVRG
jgi:hypothetical protein